MEIEQLNFFKDVYLSLETWDITLNEEFNDKIIDKHSEQIGRTVFHKKTGINLIRSDKYLKRRNFNRDFIIGCPDYFYWINNPTKKDKRNRERIWLEFKTNDHGLSKNQLMWLEKNRKQIKDMHLRIVWLNIETEKHRPGEKYLHFINRMKGNYEE